MTSKYGNELWAWVVDDPTGEHGIIAMADAKTGMAMQCVSSNRATVERIKKTVQEIADWQNIRHPIQLRHYVLSEVVDEIKL